VGANRNCQQIGGKEMSRIFGIKVLAVWAGMCVAAVDMPAWAAEPTNSDSKKEATPQDETSGDSREELEKVIAKIDAAISRDPDNPDGYVARATAWIQMAESHKAIQDLDAAI
jgi:hypothetical protein